MQVQFPRGLPPKRTGDVRVAGFKGSRPTWPYLKTSRSPTLRACEIFLVVILQVVKVETLPAPSASEGSSLSPFACAQGWLKIDRFVFDRVEYSHSISATRRFNSSISMLPSWNDQNLRRREWKYHKRKLLPSRVLIGYERGLKTSMQNPIPNCTPP